MWEVGDEGEAVGEGDTNHLSTFTLIGKRRSGVISIVMSKSPIVLDTIFEILAFAGFQKLFNWWRTHCGAH